MIQKLRDRTTMLSPPEISGMRLKALLFGGACHSNDHVYLAELGNRLMSACKIMKEPCSRTGGLGASTCSVTSSRP